MKNLVCQAQHLELNLLLYGKPVKLMKDSGDIFILSCIISYPIAVFVCVFSMQ